MFNPNSSAPISRQIRDDPPFLSSCQLIKVILTNAWGAGVSGGHTPARLKTSPDDGLVSGDLYLSQVNELFLFHGGTFSNGCIMKKAWNVLHVAGKDGKVEIV
jgi:hypothetical protein